MVNLHFSSLRKGYGQGENLVHDNEVISTDETRCRHRNELLGKDDLSPSASRSTCFSAYRVGRAPLASRLADATLGGISFIGEGGCKAGSLGNRWELQQST